MKNDERFGPNKKGGRKPGIPNKLTQDLKLLIREAFDKAGGVDYLVEQSQANPTAFMTLLAKIIPHSLEGPEGTSGKLTIRWEK